MPEFYITFAQRKYFLGIFWGCSGGGQPPCTPCPTPMAGPQAPHQLNPALVVVVVVVIVIVIVSLLLYVIQSQWREPAARLSWFSAIYHSWLQTSSLLVVRQPTQELPTSYARELSLLLRRCITKDPVSIGHKVSLDLDVRYLNQRNEIQIVTEIVTVYFKRNALYKSTFLGLHRISASASANSKFGHFSQIRPNSASAKFLAEFGRIWQTPMQLQCVQLVT